MELLKGGLRALGSSQVLCADLGLNVLGAARVPLLAGGLRHRKRVGRMKHVDAPLCACAVFLRHHMRFVLPVASLGAANVQLSNWYATQHVFAFVGDLWQKHFLVRG